ncbi:ketopantoate reductase PanE/ApbA C terminal-domain-containing protein [Trametes elegans]|nr:ketopantoate reductase PanE/ApbA C terminal-domain-containing protein [Trametes elegans]
MRIHVVGIGAVGNFVAFHLRRSLHPKHSVVALHRTNTAKALQEASHGGSLIVERDGIPVVQDGVVHQPYGEPRDRSRKSDFAPLAVTAFDDPAVRESLGYIDSLVVTTKAYAVTSVMTALRDNLSRNSTVVLLNNGMGVYEKLIEEVYPEPHDRPNFVLCSNTHGLYSTGFLHTVHAGLGQIRLGIVPDSLGRNYEASYSAARGAVAATKLNLNDIADVATGGVNNLRYLNLRNTIAALTNAPGLRASWEPFYDVQVAMRSKLVVNAFINPVSALLQCKNGEVLQNEHGRRIATGICYEAEDVFKLQWEDETKQQAVAYRQEYGVAPEPSPYPRALKARVLRQEIDRVVEATKNNYSSMCIDVKLGRPTEVDFLNGYIRDIGRRYKYRPFMNNSLRHLIRLRGSIPLAPQPTPPLSGKP